MSPSHPQSSSSSAAQVHHNSRYPTPPHSPDLDYSDAAAAARRVPASGSGATSVKAAVGDGDGDRDRDDHDMHDTRFDPLDGYPGTRPGLASSSSARIPTPSTHPGSYSRPSSSTRRESLGAAERSGSVRAEASSASRMRKRRPKDGESAATAPAATAAAAAFERSPRIPLSPPADPSLRYNDDEWREHEEAERTGGWHHIPLVLVALPPLGAIVHGRAENWSDGIILLVVCFYLYQLIKIPWDIYYASHSRRVLDVSLPPEPREDPLVVERRRTATSVLRTAELTSLATTMIVPAIGSYLLYYVRGLLSDPDRYINKFTISLFAIATSLKPFLHFGQIVKNNSLYYQEAVHYPSTEVYILRRRIETLENELSRLSRAFATKDDVRLLRDGVDVPLSQLSKAVRRFDRKEEYLRLSSEERFALLDARLEDASREVAENAALIERLKQEHDESSNPITTLLRVINHVLGHRPYVNETQSIQGSRRRPTVRWFERGPLWYLFLPVNISNLAIDWVSTNGHDRDGKKEHQIESSPDGGDERSSHISRKPSIYMKS